MNRALRLLSYEVRGLHAAVYVIALSSLLSSILALFRDRLLAHTFGASATLDIYYAAFRIPDLIFVGAGALVSVYILIPELARRTTDEQREYIDTVLVGFSIVAVLASIIAAIFSPRMLTALFPAIAETGRLPELVWLTRLMLLQPIFLGLSNIFGAITQIRQRYALYALSPILYNLGIISGILLFYPFWGLKGLALGVVVGAFMHVAIQLPSVFSDGFFHAIPKKFKPRVFLSTVMISIPRALALSMSQLSFIGLIALAGTLTSGSIAVFMFAFNLQAVPLSIIGSSYSVAAFPVLAAALARSDTSFFIEHIANAARLVAFWSLPVTAIFIVLRAHIVRVILGTGAFDWTDTRLTAAVLGLLTLSLAAQGITFLLIRGYYAAGRTFVPLLVASGTALSTLVLGAILIGVFQNELVSHIAQAILRVVDVPGSTVVALAFASTCISILGAIMIIVHFEHRFRGFLSRVWYSWLQSGIAALGAGIGAYGVLVMMGPITLASTTLTVFTRGFAAGLFGIIVAGAVYALLGSREFSELVEVVRGRLGGISVPIPQSVVVSSEESSPTTL